MLPVSTLRSSLSNVACPILCAGNQSVCLCKLASYIVLRICMHFAGACYVYPMPIYEGSTFLPSGGRLLPNYTVSHVRRRYSSRSPPCELQNLVCTFTLRHQMEVKSRCKDILRKYDKVQTNEISPTQSILHSS